VIFLLIAGCSRNNDELPMPAQEGSTVSVDWLLYEEQEQGTGQYPVRILVSKHYLRFDDNYDASDFLLLDRRTHTLFSVSHEERSILVIEGKPRVTSLPADIVLTEERSEDGDAPTIGGHAPLHVRFMANNELCYEAVIVPGLMEMVAEALIEHAELLGLRQLDSLESFPESMQTPCFLSRYAYRPARHYREGLPVREWDSEGYLRTLTDFGKNRSVSPALFTLPDDYEQFRTN
jgi:hypothetical protein